MNENWLGRKSQAVMYALATVGRRVAGRSDVRRWSDTASLETEWDRRTIAMASLVPEDVTVLEFGAGRLVLSRHLPRSCRYIPSDICDRGAGTFVCDLNERPLPVFPPHDVAVFSGVLEYVNDVPGVIDHLRGSARAIVVSYVAAPARNLLVRLKRRRAGWVNDYAGAELVALFHGYGFSLVREVPFQGTQNIYCFARRPSGRDGCS